MPKSYPVPTDGPVGEMMRATNRHPMRPAHIHFMVKKPGYDALVTHIFVDGDEYLDSDAVFGVRSSCIGNYVRHPAGTAPDGRRVRAVLRARLHVQAGNRAAVGDGELSAKSVARLREASAGTTTFIS